MANSAIMNEASIQSINNEVFKFASELKEYEATMKSVLDAFKNEALVESFFSSGNFGAQEQEKLEKIYMAIMKYNANLNGNLMGATAIYVREQESLLATGN